MSYTTHRPSILHLKQRPGASSANQETYESQYEREQAVLKAKQDKQQETRSRLLRNLHPQPEDKRAMYQELVDSNAVLASRDQRGADAYADPSADPYAAWGGSSVSPSGQGGVAEGSRPWHHSTTTQQLSAADEDAARRRFAEEVAAENVRMQRERELQRMAEQEARRQPVQDTWYQRGDTHRYAEQPGDLRGSGAWSPGAAGGGVAACLGAGPAAAAYSAGAGGPAGALATAAGAGAGGGLAAGAGAGPRPGSARPPWAVEEDQGRGGQPALVARPGRGHGAPPSQQYATPWATGDGVVVVRPQAPAAAPGPAGKLPDKQYPWSWQT